MAINSAGSWEPILTTSSGAAAAWDGVEAVSHAIIEGRYEREKERGDAEALLYAYLAAARSDESWAARATDRLNATIEQLPSKRLALFGGLCGLGWTVEHVSRLLDEAFPSGEADTAGDDDDADDLSADVDALVLRQLRQVQPEAWTRHYDYDLITGLVGYGTYFLERWPAESAKVGAALVTEYLGAVAERSDRGVAWHTPPELLPEWQRHMCPTGYYNIGVAHGVPGVIHFLNEATAAGVEHDGAEQLLEGAVDWLLAQRRPAGSGSWFSGWLAPGHSRDSRLAWCYGDLGVLSVLFQVARRRQRDDVRRFANDLLDHCLSRPIEDCGVVDAPLCHGATGVAHVYNRLYQSEGDVRCREAALAWFDRALAMRQPVSAVGGFLAATRPDPDQPTIWEASPALLDGAIGVALALLAAVSPTKPGWDRLLLMSGRDWT